MKATKLLLLGVIVMSCSTDITDPEIPSKGSRSRMTEQSGEQPSDTLKINHSVNDWNPGEGIESEAQ